MEGVRHIVHCNAARAVGLLAVVSGAIVLTCWVWGGTLGLGAGLVLAAAVSMSGVTLSERVALRAVHAHPISEIQYPKLYAVVREIATAARQPVPRLYLSPMSAPNAFATGISPRRSSVCVTAGLLRSLDERELRAVLAHELSHVYNRDSLVSSVAATVAAMIVWLLNLAWLLPLGDSEDDDASGPVSLLLFLVVGPLAAAVVHLGVSRAREYRADADAARLTGDPRGLAQALRRLQIATRTRPPEADRGLLTVSHLMIVPPLPPQGMARLFCTHPPTVERIRRLRAMPGYDA